MHLHILNCLHKQWGEIIIMFTKSVSPDKDSSPNFSQAPGSTWAISCKTKLSQETLLNVFSWNPLHPDLIILHI